MFDCSLNKLLLFLFLFEICFVIWFNKLKMLTVFLLLTGNADKFIYWICCCCCFFVFLLLLLLYFLFIFDRKLEKVLSIWNYWNWFFKGNKIVAEILIWIINSNLSIFFVLYWKLKFYWLKEQGKLENRSTINECL